MQKEPFLTGKKTDPEDIFSPYWPTWRARHTSFQEMLERKPTFAIEHAVKGMLPKTKLGRKWRESLRFTQAQTIRMQRNNR